MSGDLPVRLVPPAAGPLAASLTTLFLDREVRVADAPAWAPGPTDQCAAYRDDDGLLRGVWLVDLPLAAVTGSALVAMPASRVAETLAGGALDEVVAENFREVVNVLGSFMNGPESARLRLEGVGGFPGFADEVRSRAWASRVHFTVRVDGYGEGRMSWATS